MDTTFANPEVDATDPVVVMLAWGLTWLVGKYAPWLSAKGRVIIPMVAVIIAVGARAAVDASMGDPLNVETITRGVGAGAAAVMGHAQTRSFQKALMGPPSEDAPASEADTDETPDE